MEEMQYMARFLKTLLLTDGAIWHCREAAPWGELPLQYGSTAALWPLDKNSFSLDRAINNH